MSLLISAYKVEQLPCCFFLSGLDQHKWHSLYSCGQSGWLLVSQQLQLPSNIQLQVTIPLSAPETLAMGHYLSVCGALCVILRTSLRHVGGSLVRWRNTTNEFPEGIRAIEPALARGQEFLRTSGAKPRDIGADSGLQRFLPVSSLARCVCVCMCLLFHRLRLCFPSHHYCIITLFEYQLQCRGNHHKEFITTQPD